jgi:sialidase-1
MKPLPLLLIASLLTLVSPLFGLHAQEDIRIIASTVIQDNNFSGRGNDNEEILRLELHTTGSREVAFGILVMNLNGTTDLNDIEEIKIYSTGTSVKFDPRNPLVKGAQLLATAAPLKGEMTIPLEGEIAQGINNIWITFKVKETAKEGNQLDAEVISISTETETHTFENGNPEGSREILLRRTLVYGPGDYGSANYRIPAITTAADGSLVILTDKRKNNSIDLPEDIDIVANRSTDGGKTWSEPFLVAEGQGYGNGFGDAVIIRSNTGKLVALFVGGPGLWGSTAENPQRTYISTSDDHGQTWSPPRDITAQIYGAECPDPVRSQWQSLFFGSGHALCTRAGRLMAVMAVRETLENRRLHNYAVYSDDDGESWHVTERAISDGDEAKVVELNNGDILMSSRTKGNRLWAKSSDGGITWGPKNSWEEIWGNACDADIIRYTSTLDGYDKDRILHTLPNDSTRRNVTMWLSYDEGTTWPVKKTIARNESAYSSITILPDGTIGVYIEEDETTPYKMYFLNFSLDWLTDGADRFRPASKETYEEFRIFVSQIRCCRAFNTHIC